MASALRAGLAANTHRAYGPGLRAWAAFCTRMGWTPLLHGDAPETRREAEYRILCFAVHLAQRVSVATIKVYLAAVHQWHVQEQGTHPWATGLRLPLLLEGLRRLQQRQPVRRTPVTVDILRQWREHFQLQHLRDATIWAALLLAFFGLLRKSEFTVSPGTPFDATRHLARQDVRFLYDSAQVAVGMEVHVKFSKAHQTGCVQPVPIAARGDDICPVGALQHLLTLCAGPPDAPLLCLPSGPLTTPEFSRAFQTLTAATPSLRGAYFAPHSLRIGGAMALHEAGAPDSVLQLLGRWSSTAFQDSLRFSRRTLLTWSARIGSHVASSTPSLVSSGLGPRPPPAHGPPAPSSR